MAAFMDLFDPSLTDEPVIEDLEDLDELLSASALLDNKKSNGTNHHQNNQNGNSKTPKTTKRIFPNNKLPPRSKTTLDLSTHYTCPESRSVGFLSFYFLQLPGRQFSLSDICKKLSHHFLLEFSIGMGSYDHHEKYQGVFS
jgi:hypothetical protein